MSKMTDKDIIKALKVCSITNTVLECKDCPYDTFNARNCTIKLCEDALDLINRQQAEIENLKAKCENTQIGYNFAQDYIKTLKKDKYKLQKALNQSEDYRVIAKAEAIKEFVNSATDLCYKEFGSELEVAHTFAAILTRTLDSFEKEMVGEQG